MRVYDRVRATSTSAWNTPDVATVYTRVVMAQKMLDVLDVVTPIETHGLSSEYSIKCGSDISMSVRKETEYSVTIQKGRTKLEMTMDEWRRVIANCETIELGYLLLSGNLGRVYTEHV